MSLQIQPDKFLLEEDDGLPVRDSQPYALYKLKALTNYASITNQAMHKKLWRRRYYIDLQAGPGKNSIGSNIYLGSPLIALTTTPGFTDYRFNEFDPNLANALRERVSASPYQEMVQISEGDANEIVVGVCDEIDSVDRDKSYGDRWSSLNLAFLDPEGLELEWRTVERLAQVRKMDLIINFSTSGLLRNMGAENWDIIDRFFGTTAWRKHISATQTSTDKRRNLIDFYRSNLEKFGYYIEIDPDANLDIAFKNSRNVQVYSLIFASKDKLGDKFWKVASKNPTQPKLL